MTSEERHEARYKRRKAKRTEKKVTLCARNDNFDQVFTYDHLYQSYRKCIKGVSWKASVQKFILMAPANLWRLHNQLHKGIYKSAGFFEFDIYERGKLRHIKSVTIEERVVQRCLCDYSLVPMLTRTFVYDNGASMKNKGYTFSMKRLRHKLRRYIRTHGTGGYILLFDFSRFFDRVSHEVVKRILRKEYTDERLLRLIYHFIDAFGPVGMGLGSQISQVLALASANRLDHAIAELMRIGTSARYMDDGYLIHEDKAYLRHCLSVIQEICAELEITLNVKKTQIVKLSHGFTYLKGRFYVTKSGKIITKIYKRSVTRERRKLKSLARKLEQGEITFNDIWAQWQSWKSYAATFMAWHTIQSVGRLFDRLFIEDWRLKNSVLCADLRRDDLRCA